ncbi:MAG: YbhN family protein [Acidimicrobiales bacterium]
MPEPELLQAEIQVRNGWRRHWKRWLVVALAVIILFATIQRYRSILGNSITQLGHLRWGAVWVAVALEWTSMAAFARMQRSVLRSGGIKLTIESMVAITYAGNAIAVTLPIAGSGVGTAFLHRQFSARGATRAVATWALLLSGIFSTVAFGLVVSAGAIVSGHPLAEVAGVAGVVLVALPLVAVRVASTRPRIEDKLIAVGAWAVKQGRRITKKTGDDPELVIREAIQTMAALRVTRFDKVVASVSSVLNWLLDIGCLALSIRAVGLHVPWNDLILAWAAGAGAASFNLTPGGLGVVEPALAAALVAARLPATKAMAAVLLYRFISFWLILALGWILYWLVRRRRSGANAATEPQVTLG